MRDHTPSVEIQSAAHPEEKQSTGIFDWLGDNVAKPFANSLAVEPWNVAVNVLGKPVNAASHAMAGVDIMQKAEHFQVKQAQFLSAGWFCQTASGGLGAVIPYALAGKGMGSAMRATGARLEATGALAGLLKSESVAQIAGAAAFDGLRDTRQGETHLGNALGSASGFFIFEKGNRFARGFSLSKQLPLQALTGMVGAPVQASVSRLMATGDLPNQQELIQSSVSGGFMNTALPYMQRGIAGAADRAAASMGFGVPIERYASNRFGAGEGTDPFASPTFKAAINDSWARVKTDDGQLSFAPRTNTIRIAADAGAEKLGHEAIHSLKTAGEKAAYEQVQGLAVQGKTQEAWTAYRQLRLDGEKGALAGESQILTELGQKPLFREGENLEQTIPSLKVSDGRTYEEVWRADFDKAMAGLAGARPGNFVPPEEFGNQASYDRNAGKTRSNAEWHEFSRQWGSLKESDKVSGLNGVRFAPAGLKMEVFRQGIKDASAQVRLTAAQALHHFEPGKRQDMWRLMLHSDDHFVRQIALTSIKDLPANVRENAWRHALNFRPAMLVPSKESAAGGLRKSSDSQTADYEQAGLYTWSRYSNKPVVPEFLEKSVKEKLGEPPAKLLITALQQMPRGSRYELWQQALQDKRTADAAMMNLNVLPDADITRAWNMSWARSGKGLRQDDVRDAVVKQIADLPRHERQDALSTVAAERSHVEPEAMVAALKSLPEDQRTSVWNQLLESSKPLPEVTGYGDRHSFYRPRRSWWEEETRNRGLGAAIEALPLTDRTPAWHQLAQLDTKVYGSQLIRAIEHLPQGDRLSAVKQAIEKFPDIGLAFGAIGSVPGQHFLEIVETIMSKTDGEMRAKLLRDFPTYSHQDAPLADKATWMAGTFSTALRHAKPEDMQSIREWWAQLPEKFDENSQEELIPQLVKEQLAEKLSVPELSKLIFHDQEQETAALMAKNHPEVISEIAKNAEDMLMPHESRHLARVAQQWYDSGSLLETVKVAASPEYGPNDWFSNHDPVPLFIDKIVGRQSQAEKTQSIEMLRDMVLSERSPVSEQDSATPSPQIQLAFVMARRLAAGQTELLQSQFLEPIQKAMFDTHRDYAWRLATARDVAALQRSTMFNEANSIMIPDLRMPRLNGMTQAERVRIRQNVENALYEPTTALYKMMGDGELGKLFPGIFGYHEQGGIVGRPQHGGHEYPLHAHTLLVVRRTLEHPEFQRLSPKDQTNVLWAALLHDVGKRASKSDPDHEWASANMSWGILRTLGYSPVRTQRIASLISRHREMSFDPATLTSEKMAANSDFQYDLATFYRNPTAISQLQIFNEADIKSVNAASDLWKPNVAHELHEISRIARETGKGLNQNMVPILTSEVPDRFGLFSMPGDYALLGHYSRELGDNFLKQLALIESPEYSISASLITPSHKQFYMQKPDLVALVAAPPEQVSQAYRDNLGTGTSIAWKGHVKLAREWMESDKANSLAAQIDRTSRMLGVKSMGGKFGSLAQHRKRVLGYDSLDEMRADVGMNSAAMKTQKAINEALTHEENGEPLDKHNEVKLNNPTVVGFGILRRNRPVLFENADPAFIADRLSQNGDVPKWLVTNGAAPPHALTIAESIWKAAIDKDLPFVVLDP